ncbi:Eukaryotic translation initiation factor 2A [[Candida] zeylanoides]
MSASTQFFCRIPKSVNLIQDYEEITSFPKPSLECRAALYSPNGEYFAYTQPHEVVVVRTTPSAPLQTRIEIADAFDIFFSPSGTYLCLWCKPVLLDHASGVWTKNVKVINIRSGNRTVLEWSNKHQGGWRPQFTVDERILAKGTNNKEIDFYELPQVGNGKVGGAFAAPQEVTDADADAEAAADAAIININRPTHKYKPDRPFGSFQLSTGRNPYIAVFIPEKDAQPAQVLIYNIPNFAQPICQKSFFKAERCQLRWNALGTALLALASTDHDTTNKSYYGETNLYLLGIAGSYDSRIHLDKEGPIHDFTWSPSSREFGVIYGYMPAKTTFFDARGNSIFSLPPAPRNTILFSPHARFVLVAGFGNLQGTVDVYDRQNKFAKLTTFEATNTSVCEWSPCGRFILTATTAPRLRVDNGLKVWHATGKLVYLKEYPELYSIGWKPQGVQEFPQLKVLEPAPEPHVSTTDFLAKKLASDTVASAKPAGAYRPPHARGSSGPAEKMSLYQKELLARGNSPNAAAGAAAAAAAGGGGSALRAIPGAAPAAAKPESKSALKNRKKREAKKKEEEDKAAASAESSSPTPGIGATVANAAASAASAVAAAAADTVNAVAGAVEGGSVVGGTSSFEDKKIRSLLKKLRAIEQLKMKQASGEPLEDTQVSKIQKEEEIRKELEVLGWSE